MIRGHLRPALAILTWFTLVTGVVYPAVVTAAARAVFAGPAEGSLLRRDGRIVGSALIGQPFDDPRYFWGRSSATPGFAHNAAASAGSNLGPAHPALAEAVAARVGRLRSADPDNPLPIPIDLVTASGSGLDPHISPAAARYQVGRVARARGLDPDRVRRLVDAHVEPRTAGVLGEPRVNVLQLNLALDALP